MTIKVKIPERRPSAVRLRAQLRATATPMLAEPPRPAPAPTVRPMRPLPSLPPLSLGQALRASLLALLCLGLTQLPHGDRAWAEKKIVAPGALATK